MRLLVPMVAALLALAACGDSDSPFVVSPSSTAAGPTETPVTSSPTTLPSNCEPTAYEVAEGDTLGSLAETFGVTVDAIVEASALENPDVLAIGDPLTIPCPTEAPSETPEGTPEGTPTDGA